MTKAESISHQVVLEFQEPIPSEVPVGSNLVLKVNLSCPAGCNLSSRIVRLMSGEEILQETAGVPDEDAEVEESPIKAPEQVGAYTWTVLFPRQEINGIVHEQASLPVTFATKAHESSLAVWDVPATVVTGDRFRIKVGARSSGACALSGDKIEVLDTQGGLVGSGQLGETPWPGTTALYWTEIELPAPENKGVVAWAARFGATDSELPHSEGKAPFGFVAVPPPEHRITIKIVEQDTGNPIGDVQIRLGPFRSATDASGVAELTMPKGNYEMTIWHPRWESPATQVEICEDQTIELRSTPVPEEDPDAAWM
jgi:hypothetical protein